MTARRTLTGLLVLTTLAAAGCSSTASDVATPARPAVLRHGKPEMAYLSSGGRN